jgi:hypothetical protein
MPQVPGYDRLNVVPECLRWRLECLRQLLDNRLDAWRRGQG